MWEALAGIGSIASAVVIAVTVVLAARQVKVTTDQLEQTRRAAQFEAVRSVLLEMVEPRFVNAYRFIVNDLPSRLQDEQFYREVATIGLADDSVHQELYMLRALDRIGTYVKFGLVDGEIIYANYRARIVLSWEILSGVVAIHRQIGGAQSYESAQFLYEDCKRWLHARDADIDTSALLRRVKDFSGSATPLPHTGAGG